MSILTRDENGRSIPTFSVPVSGATASLVIGANVVATTPLLVRGVYRIVVPLGSTVSVASGAVCLATDMTLTDGEYFFGTATGETLSFLSTAAFTLQYTLMP